MHPGLSISAVEAGKRGLPSVGALVRLGLVDVVGDSPQLGRVDVVGKLLALAGGPGVGTGHPGVLERDHVVDIDVRGGGPDTTVVGRGPGTAGSRASGVGNDVGAVTLEDVLAGRCVSGCDTTRRG